MSDIVEKILFVATLMYFGIVVVFIVAVAIDWPPNAITGSDVYEYCLDHQYSAYEPVGGIGSGVWYCIDIRDEQTATQRVNKDMIRKWQAENHDG